MKKLVAAILCLMFCMPFAGCVAPPEQPEGFLHMGMNVSAPHYYHGRTLMFHDVLKTKHAIGTASHWQGGYTGEVDADGYPLEVVPLSGGMWNAAAPVILINDIYDGDYVFLYDGEGDVQFDEGIEVLERKEQKIYLRLTECVRTTDKDPHRRITITRSVKGNHIRNMRMIPLQFEHSEQTMPLFRADFLKGLEGMGVLRFMDAQSTNSSKQVHWDDRVKVSDWSYDVQGLPLEIMIELANTLNADAWFCVPHQASDDYIQKMAQLIRQKLKPSLKCYIEYSNEIWHTGFPQGVWIETASDSVHDYIKQDLANLKSAKYGNDTRHLKNAYFMARTFRIFSGVFAGSARNRLVTVGTYYFWEYPTEMIEYLIAQNQKPDVMAGSGYFNFTADDHARWMQNPSAVTAEDVLDAVLNEFDTRIAPNAAAFASMVHEFGIDYVVYEGGQHMQPYNQQVHPYNQAVYDAQIHPKMYELYIKNFRLYESLDCKMFVNFSYVGLRESQYGSWGVLENVGDVYSENLKEIAPKYQAILDANKRDA